MKLTTSRSRLVIQHCHVSSFYNSVYLRSVRCRLLSFILYYSPPLFVIRMKIFNSFSFSACILKFLKASNAFEFCFSMETHSIVVQSSTNRRKYSLPSRVSRAKVHKDHHESIVMLLRLCPWLKMEMVPLLASR